MSSDTNAGPASRVGFLSPEWMAAARSLGQTLPTRPGLSARIGFQISGTPQGEVRYVVTFEDGRVIDQAISGTEGADVTFVLNYADAQAMQRGEIDQNVAFMQGRMKVAPGADMAKLMTLLPVTLSAEFRDVQRAMHELTAL